MNNANCYALENKARYIYDSDQEQQYQFHGSSIVRTQKSMSMASVKLGKQSKQNQMKKSNSFLLSNSKLQSSNTSKKDIDNKQKSKGSKKCLNITQIRKKPPINSKNSMNKTSVSIGSISGKSTKPASKKRSISRDFLILDQQIYQCDNIEEINQKLVCRNTDLYSHERFIKATLKNQQKIQNYIKCFAQYIKYSVNLKRDSQIIFPKNSINVNNLSMQQKKRLYALLKNQTQQNKQRYNQKKTSNLFFQQPLFISHHQPKPQFQANSMKQYQNNFNKSYNNSHKKDHTDLSIQSLIKQAYHKIQQKTSIQIKKRPEQQKWLKKWKNDKLHQLMQINTYLNEKDNDKPKRNSIQQNNDSSNQQIIKANMINFNRDRDSKEQQNIYSQSTIQADLAVDVQQKQWRTQYQQEQKYVENVSNKHKLRQQKYTQSLQELKEKQRQKQNKNVYDQHKYLPDQHIFSTSGIQQFLHSLWNYLVDTNRVSYQLIKNIKKSHGLTNNHKNKLVRDTLRQQTKIYKYNGKIGVRCEEWQSYIMLNNEKILTNQLFVQFCKSEYNTLVKNYKKQQNTDGVCQQSKYLVIFEKLLFDNLNLQLNKYQQDYPYGCYHPLQHNYASSAYNIDEDNIMVVWQQCIASLVQQNQLAIYSIRNKEEDCGQSIRSYGYNNKVPIYDDYITKQEISSKQQWNWAEQKFKTMVKMDLKIIPNDFIMPLQYHKVYEQLLLLIQQQIIITQMSRQLHKF